MTKLETLRSLPSSGTPPAIVQTVAELQRQIEALQPQRQIEEALERLQIGLQSLQSQYGSELQRQLEALRPERQIEELLKQLQSGFLQAQSQRLEALEGRIEETLEGFEGQMEETRRRHTSQLEEARSQHLDSLASKVEPMAQAMVSLTEETRSTLTEIQATAARYQQETAARWQTALESCNAAIAEVEAERRELLKAAEEARKAAQSVRRWSWKGWALAILAGALSGVLTAASWTYLRPPTAPTWSLDASEVAEMLWPELEKRLPPTIKPKSKRGEGSKQP